MPLEPIPCAPTYELDQARRQLDCASSCCRRASNLMMLGMAADATRPIEEALTLLLLSMGGATRHQLDAMVAKVAEMQSRLDEAQKERGA
ncbi:MAG: hypothetical protein RIS45_574 [Planctomycetota bacterium]